MSPWEERTDWGKRGEELIRPVAIANNTANGTEEEADWNGEEEEAF